MPQSSIRVVGSTFTTLRWRGSAIAYLEAFTDSGVSPIANPQAIQPLDSLHPTEFVTPRALNGGTLSFTIRELWDKPVWQHFSGLANANNIVDIWTAIADLADPITCQTIIKPPTGNVWRTKTYHNVIVSDIDDSESVSIGALSVSRQVTAQYTHATRGTLTPSETQ